MTVWRDLRDMLILGRFHFLLGGFLLFSLGALIALSLGSEGGILRFLLGYSAFFPAHLSVSYSNDLYDQRADSFGRSTPFSGGSGVLKRRPELRTAALVVSLSLIALSLTMSLIFTVIFSMGPFFPLYVLLGALLGWFYTAPPLSLSYHRMGEISTTLVVGLLVPFMGYWVMMGRPDLGLLPFTPSLLLYGGAFILNVQVPDLEADISGGKRSIVTMIGRKRALRMVLVLNSMACLYFLGLYIMGLGPDDYELLPFAAASVLPLLTSIPSVLVRAGKSGRSTTFATANLLSNFVFLGSLDLAILLSL